MNNETVKEQAEKLNPPKPKLQFLNDDSKAYEFFNLTMNRANRKAFLKKHTIITDMKETKDGNFMICKALYKMPNVVPPRKLQIVCTASYREGEIVEGRKIEEVKFDLVLINNKRPTGTVEKAYYLAFIYSMSPVTEEATSEVKE